MTKESNLVVRKAPEGMHCADPRVEEMPLTNELCELIARRNENMTAAQVRAELMAGNPVYTNFSRYWVEK